MFLSSVTVVECSRVYHLVRAEGVLPRELENDLTYASNLSSCDLMPIYMCARSIATEERQETTTKLIYFCASVLELCSTEIESFVRIELSCGVDFALQFGKKAWKRIFVGREFYNTLVLIRDKGLCMFVEKSLQRITQAFFQIISIKPSGS